MSTHALLLIWMLALSVNASADSSAPIDGQVLEYGTRVPIAGAIVLAHWDAMKSLRNRIGLWICGHNETAVTDKSGHFHIPGWSEPPRSPGLTMFGDGYGLYVYKVGYGSDGQFAIGDDNMYSTQIDSAEYKSRVLTLFMKPYTRTRDDRFNYLHNPPSVNSLMKCSALGVSAKKALPFAKAVYEEASTIAKTPKEKRILEDSLFDIEGTEFGYDIARKRQIERARGVQ